MHKLAQTLEMIRQKWTIWLRQGVSPRRLALTLALGFVIGCLPVVGIPTALCAAVALAFRLNQPAIQAANYAAMPFQVALMVPLVRLGGRLWSSGPKPLQAFTSMHPVLVMGHSTQWAMQLGGMAGQALLAWLLMAVPVLFLLTATLTMLLRRVPLLAEASDRELA